MTQIADIVKSCHSDTLYMVVDVEYFLNDHYIFRLYNLETSSCDSWFEPFDQALNASYWQTLA